MNNLWKKVNTCINNVIKEDFIKKKKRFLENDNVFIYVGTAIFFILAIVLLINANENANEILAKKTTYEYPYKTVIKVNKNGGIYKSKIIDELTKEGPPKDKFSKVGTIPNEDLIEIEDIINEMKEEQKKSSNYSENYGLAVNIGDSSLYGCEYFSQENVDKLNSIIQKYE